jgi:hypothetical protein
MCCTGNFNLLYKCLTGFEVRQTLRNLKTTVPDFQNELTQKTAAELVDIANEQMPGDEDNIETLFEDNSDLPCEAIVARVIGSKSRASVIATPDGSLMSVAAAESLDRDETDGDNKDPEDNNGLRHGKRKITKNKQYASFWCHNDDDASDCEEY